MIDAKDIADKYTSFVKFNDPLDKVTYSLALKETIDYIKYIGYVDVGALWNLFNLNIKFAHWLMIHKSIKEEDAFDLLKSKSILFEDFISIINNQIDLLSSKIN